MEEDISKQASHCETKEQPQQPSVLVQLVLERNDEQRQAPKCKEQQGRS